MSDTPESQYVHPPVDLTAESVTPDALRALREQTYGRRPKPRPSPEALRATAEYDHKNAALWRAAADTIEAARQENELLRAALAVHNPQVGTIEALTADRDEAVALLREQNPASGSWRRRRRVFLARLDKENGL